MKNFSHKQWVWLVVICVVVFIGIQFIRPGLENPPVTSVIQLPDPVQQVLVRSCFDCHTSMTKYSWFDQVAPVSWVVRDHVREGRQAINFSQWDSLTKDQQKVFLFESLNQMQFQVMPLGQYAFIHRSAKPGPMEISVLKSYLGGLVSSYSPDTVKTNKWKDQYSSWMHGYPPNINVEPSLNGIHFNPDYKNWVAISSTERFDNGTMRVIVGNHIAVNAVKAHRTNLWPDGSVIVKILWITLVDSSGNLQPGAFRQADFMIKDKKKYSDTEGWGFARWTNGLKLTPYGKNPLFATECVNCHRSMRAHDFIFTDPVNLNAEKVMEGRVITSLIQRKNGTMSTLYGNDIAVQFARSHTTGRYPAGSELTFITWKQKEDDHWYGARIPDMIEMMEKIRVTDSGKGILSSVYERVPKNAQGKPDRLTTDEEKSRTRYILSLCSSVMP